MRIIRSSQTCSCAGGRQGTVPLELDALIKYFLIWYADLDHVTADVYPERPVGQSVITGEDVMKIQGEVASPAELKKRLDELKTDIEKKIHTVEQSQQNIKWLLGVLVTAIVALFIGVVVKPYLDRSKDAKQTPPTAQAADKPPPAPGEKADGKGSAKDSAKPVDQKPLVTPDKRDDKTGKSP